MTSGPGDQYGGYVPPGAPLYPYSYQPTYEPAYEPPPPTAPPPYQQQYEQPYPQPFYGPSGYGPSDFGQPPYGGGPPNGQPTPPSKPSPSKAMLALIVVCAVVVAVVVVILALNQGGDGQTNAQSPLPLTNATDATNSPGSPGSPTPTAQLGSGNDPVLPTGTDAPSDGPSVASAQVLAMRYFADLNAKNQTDARGLLCEAAKSGFDDTVRDPDNDFTFTWSDIGYKRAGAVGNEITVLNYQVTLTKNARTQGISLLLYFVNEGGVKICGEASE